MNGFSVWAWTPARARMCRNLSGVDLSGVDLSGAYLRWADLSRACVVGALFSDAMLEVRAETQ